jgi:FTR1 family protein
VFEALVITLREGVEAALVLAIAASLLERRGLGRLRGPLFAGAAVAVALSAAAAAAAARLTWNQDLVEGVAMLVGAVLVFSLVWWMWRTAPRVQREIEEGLARASGGGGGSATGMFLFAFGMVFREGLETAVFLTASGFNSQGVERWMGALAGLALAVLFGVLFARGTLKVALRPFFSLTSAVLLLIGLQLLVGGLHELSEIQILPSSRREMALIGPLVKNELLLFTLTVAVAAGWLLRSTVTAGDAGDAAAASGPGARLARSRRRADLARRRWTGIVGLLVVAFLATAFVQRSRLPARAAATPVPLVDGAAVFDTAGVGDGRLHFFEATLPEGPVRWFALRVGGDVRVCLDACEICGDKGYFQDGGAVVCRNCISPIVPSSIGRSGGCNPIPLAARAEGGRLVVAESALREALPLLRGR